MLENNNLKVCLRLFWRDFRFHKIKNALLILSMVLVTGLFTFLFLLSNAVREGYLLNYQNAYGSSSHVLFFNMTKSQVKVIERQPEIKGTVKIFEVGQLTDEMIGKRIVKLAGANVEYAESVSSVPTVGQLPMKDNEIAMDVFTLDSLGIPRKIGTEVSLQWKTLDGTSRHSEFILCGWWESPTNFSEACAWLSEDSAKKQSAYDANITLGVTLFQPGELEVQAEELLDKAGISNIAYTTNLAFNKGRITKSFEEAGSYFFPCIFVTLCGFLMVYSIMHVAMEQELTFFTQVKALGMSPRQLRLFAVWQAVFICTVSLLPGWVLGFFIYYYVIPYIVIGMDGNPALYFFRIWPFFLAAIAAILTAVTAYLVPLYKMTGSTPAEVIEQANRVLISKEKGGASSKILLHRMAVRSLRQNKGRTMLSFLSLFIAILFLSISWIKYISYDENIYLASYCPWDYSFIDCSAAYSMQRYNPNSNSITNEFAEKVMARREVERVSILKTYELPMKASERLQKTVMDFYHTIREDGMTRREYMLYDPQWSEGLADFEKYGEYTGLIVGVEGEYLDYIVNYHMPVDGIFDKKAFSDGKYVLTSGAESEELSTMAAGESIELFGKQFTVMASLMTNSAFINGADSPKAAFQLTYYVPLSVFNEICKSQNIRQMAVNINREKQADFEQFLDSYEQDTENKAVIQRKSDFMKLFENARLTEELANFLTGIVLLVIGVINFVNLLLTKTVIRKKEFAIYQSLGMTPVQLKQLLLLEGMLHAILLMVGLLPAIVGLTWFGMPVVMSHMNTWCMTYHYTLAPLLAALPFILLTAILIPLGCYQWMTKENLTQRLH